MDTKLVTSILEPGDTFVDIGANIGWFSIIGSLIVGESGKVISFEPDRLNYQILQNNILRNNISNTIAYNSGVSSEDGLATFYRSKDNFGDHRFSNEEFEKREQVLASLVNPSNILLKNSRIRLIKSDTQGFECQVLMGLINYIHSVSHKPILLLEFWPYGILKSNGSIEVFSQILDNLNYNVFLIDENRFQLTRLQPNQLQSIGNQLLDTGDKHSHANILCIHKTRNLLII